MVGATFDPLVAVGGPLLQDRDIGAIDGCVVVGGVVPPEATLVALRRSNPLFGLGLVDAAQTFLDLARRGAATSPRTAGHPNLVTDLATRRTVVGKFDWKAQVPTLFQFSGDAYRNEMGITNPFFLTENCPQGDCALLACDPVPEPEDDGTDVAHFTDFMSFLAAPPRGANTAAVGEGFSVFERVGCAACHTPNLQTGPSPVPNLSRVAFQPVCDFLLHDMDSLGDGMFDQAASRREMRTAPLWGLSALPVFLHDGRAPDVTSAILAHDGQGASARDRFSALGAQDESALLAFLASL